jgi:thiol-disulfide isomerase/thioredoxin
MTQRGLQRRWPGSVPAVFRFRGASLAVVALLGACSPAALPERAPIAQATELRRSFPNAEPECRVARQVELREAPRAIAPGERVPEFLLATKACQVFDSHELVGKVPFVVVFFASWCSVCEHKVPLLRDALREREGQVTSLWISLDDATGDSAETDAFLERNELAQRSAVSGRDFLGFSLGYNPFRSVPVVVVVGRSGRVVVVQIGVRDGDDAVLEQALDEAIDQAPERTLFTSFPRP